MLIATPASGAPIGTKAPDWMRRRPHQFGLTPFSGSTRYVSPVPRALGENGSHDEQAKKTPYPGADRPETRQADRLLGEGNTIADACRELGVTEQTYYRWRNQNGGMKADDAKRLKELEKQNATLKRMLAEAELEKAALKELAEGNF